MSIEEMDFTIRTYNSLHSAKIKTAKDIENIGTQNLFKIRNLGKLNIIEIITKMRSLGYYMDDIKSNEAEEQLALTDEDINDNLNNGYYKKVKIDIQEANDVMKTSLSQIGISSLVLNKLKKSKIYTVGDVAELGIKKLKNVQGLNKKMCKELLDKLYSVGVIVK